MMAYFIPTKELPRQQDALQTRLGWLLRLLLISWLLSKFSCYGLWMGDRLFPPAPVAGWMQDLPDWLHSSLFWVSVVLMLACIIRPGKRLALLIIVLELLTCLLDQNRWQPWEYQFIVMLACYAWMGTAAQITAGWQIIFCGIYFFSGLSKLQPAFIHDVWSQVILRGWLGIYPTEAWQFRLGYLLPIIEMAAAICLIIKRFRKIAVFILVAMHLGILTVLGPWAMNWNSSVWAWNMLMAIGLVGLFYKTSSSVGGVFRIKWLVWLLVLLFWLLPWLQLAGKWDRYLSFSLYSGAFPRMYICIENPEALPEGLPVTGPVKSTVLPCSFYINSFKWAGDSMNCFPYPEERVFKIIARQFVARYPGAGARFYVYKSGFRGEWRELKIE